MEILSSTISPVHRLNDDILLYILGMNADMFEDDKALITSRATSQVCRSWRELMLESPLLWGKLVDFDIIGQHKVEALWADELIRRSGSTSAVWIKAHRALTDDSPRPELREIFLKVLSENWHRTQILVVNLRWTKFDLRRGFCDTISLPAPGLVSFDFTAGASADNIPYQAIPAEFKHPLFANKAPYLRKFKATFHKFDLRAPWLHHLSDLYISHPFPLRDILDALATMNNLEFLEIKHVEVHQDDIQHLRRANLPRLSKFQLSVDAITCVALLDRLWTPPTCGLTYNALRLLTATDVAEDVFTPLVRRLAKFARRYCRSHPPVHVVLHREHGTLCFSDMHYQFAFGFIVILQCSDQLDFPVDAVKTFFSQFSLLRFPKTTHIWLKLSAGIPSHLWRPFLERFPSAEVMTMSIRDIGYFKVFAEILLQTRVLPLLKIIKLKPGEQFDPAHAKPHELEVIIGFRVMRIMTGRPVQVVPDSDQ